MDFTLQLNARLRPLDRGDIYEDPLYDILESQGLGETTGGGTMLSENGEVDFCDVEIALNEVTPENIEKLIKIVEDIGVPKGSLLYNGDFEYHVGNLEGLALYINGTELADEVYETCDFNHVVDKVRELIDGHGNFYSYCELADTALYFYGTSYAEMKAKITPFLDEYPLCQKCRVEQIA